MTTESSPSFAFARRTYETRDGWLLDVRTSDVGTSDGLQQLFGSVLSPTRAGARWVAVSRTGCITEHVGEERVVF